VRDEHLYAFVADTRAGSAAEVRRRTRWLQQQLRAEASFADLCRDLAAWAAPVEVALTSGREHRGRIAGIGVDVLALQAVDATTAYVATRAVVGVRALAPTGDAGAADGGRALRGTQVFVDVLADLADRRDRVAVGTVAPRTYRGVLAGVAQDFIWFDDNPRCVRLDTITDVVTDVAS
jgi:small nuclear ribonucleoprotein (snRNP)-like protein